MPSILKYEIKDFSLIDERLKDLNYYLAMIALTALIFHLKEIGGDKPTIVNQFDTKFNENLRLNQFYLITRKSRMSSILNLKICIYHVKQLSLTYTYSR